MIEQQENPILLKLENVLKLAIDRFRHNESIDRQFWVCSGFPGKLSEIENLMKQFFDNSSDSTASWKWKEKRIEMLKKISGRNAVIDYFKEKEGGENFIIYFMDKPDESYSHNYLVISFSRPYFTDNLPDNYSQSFGEEE